MTISSKVCHCYMKKNALLKFLGNCLYDLQQPDHKPGWLCISYSDFQPGPSLGQNAHLLEESSLTDHWQTIDHWRDRLKAWFEWMVDTLGWSAWLSGRTPVSGQRSFAVLRSACSWWVTTYVGKPSAIGQPTRPTQPFILSGSINE